MSRRPASHTQTYMNRAAKAARLAGMAVEFMPDGVVRFVPPAAPGEPEAPAPISAFDAWKAKQNAGSAERN